MAGQKKPTNNFNISAEQSVQNRISPYNLNDKEKTQVWKIVADRNQQLDAEKKKFNNKDKFQASLKKEYQKLKQTQNPTNQNISKPKVPQLNFDPPGGAKRYGSNQNQQQQNNNGKLKQQAYKKVIENYKNKTADLQKTADKKINKILDNARQNGRGPQGLQHNFQRAHDNEQTQNRG